LTTVEKVAPKQLWTLHGDGKHLKAHYGDRLFTKALD
jgi:putative mRNA 3-end processing factor